MNVKIFPYIMMVLNIGASVVYFLDGDIRKGFYWLFAFGLTLVITI
jgi:hypothetical protein